MAEMKLYYGINGELLQPEWKPSNREKSQMATKHKFWCGRCDTYLVGEHGKCPVCGYVEQPHKQKV